MNEHNHAMLICTVGGTPDPLVKSILHWRPARVIFVPSQQSLPQVDSVLRSFAEHSGSPLSPGCYRICPVEDAEGLPACVDNIKTLDVEVEDWLKRGGEYEVVADFTAGTKCMSAALALQARRWRCHFSYVGGAHRTKEGVGVVESGAERVVYSANPWEALGFQAVEDFVVLFDQHSFAAAADVAARALRNVGQPARKRELNALKLLAEAYDAWDRFDLKTATNKVCELAKHENDLRATFGQSAMDKLRSLTNAHRDHLQRLVDSTAPTIEHVCDLLANARRRKSEGRIDDAVARLYRAIEALAQVALKERHQIANTKAVPLSRVPEPLHSQWTARADQGMVALGLQDAYALLSALGDALGATFKQLQLEDWQKSPLTARNQSILAHGFERVSDKVFDQLWDASLKLANVAESNLLAFPRLAGYRA